MIPIPATLPDLHGGQPESLGLIRRLESGASLTGRVQRPTADGATPILVGGSLLTLVLSEPVEPGTVVRVRSENGALFVEPREGAGDQPASSPRTASQGSASLFPVPTSLSASLTQVLAKVLQANNLPAQLETLQVLQTALGNFPPEQAPVLALLLARNVPITPQNLEAVRERLRARGNLGRELGTLAAEIGKLLGTGSVRGADRLASTLVRVQDILSWVQGGDLRERIEHLKDFVGTLEEKLLGGQIDKARSDFKMLLLELDFLLSQAELADNHPLRTSTRKVIHLIEGAHLLGLAQVGEPNREAWVFWRIPFPGDPAPTTVELAVRGERDPQHPERYDPRDLELLLQVELSHLGPVRVRIRSAGEELRVGLSVVDKKHREYLLKEIPLLVESLNHAGYDKVQTEVRVESNTPGSLADELDPLKGWEKRLEEPPPSVDIRL